MKDRFDSRGIAHPLAIVLVAVVLGTVGFAGWRVMEKNKDDKNSSNSAVSTAETREIEQACNKELDDKDFCKFASNFNLETPYKATMTNSDSEGTTVSEMESDGKGNTSLVSKKDDKVVGAFITLDNVSYFKDMDSDTWYKMASSEEESDYDAPVDDFKIDAKDITKDDKISYKKLGKERCNNLNCFKYQIIDTESPDLEQFVWFDDKDYRMQRWSTKDSSGSSDMTFSYASINIKAPSPVKDFQTTNSADVDAAQEAMTASEE